MSPRSGERSGFPPIRKSLGQHFLTDQSVLERIADAMRLDGTETLIEIGPGRGALTDLLVGRAGRLIAIEYDRALAAKLVERYAGRTNVEIVQADVLSVQFADLARGPYKLIGNVQKWDLRRRAKKTGWIQNLPGPAAGWTQIRDMPPPAKKTFHQMWKKRKQTGTH